MSMAAGEYVSVSSQADTERADLARETRELAESPEAELRELQNIYISRGLDADLALRVAEQLSAGDRLAAHARDELGITEAQAAKPIQAALASAATFSVGAALPLVIAALAPTRLIIALVTVASLISLAGLGALAAGAGGAGRWRGAIRVTFLERTRDGADRARRPGVRRDGVTIAK
jgi:VIT1/CCC1 family predicted Fe2+/Mn2+ transporter